MISMKTGFNSQLGIEFLGLDGGWIRIRLQADERHIHEQGYVHGGVILSLLDVVMARAVRHALGAETYAPTIELNASFLRPLRQGPVNARARVVNAGRRLLRVEGEVLNSDQKLSAIGRGSFVVAA